MQRIRRNETAIMHPWVLQQDNPKEFSAFFYSLPPGTGKINTTRPTLLPVKSGGYPLYYIIIDRKFDTVIQKLNYHSPIYLQKSKM